MRRRQIVAVGVMAIPGLVAGCALHLRRGRPEYLEDGSDTMREPTILLGGVAMGECPRWHDGRLWFADWGAQEVVTVDLSGNRETALSGRFGLPFSIDWLPDGRMLIVSGGQLMRQEIDGSLTTLVDLRTVSPGVWNELVVDGRGNAYVNGGEGVVAVVRPEGAVERFAEGLAWPNGMAVTPDGRTLIVAESHGGRLAAFDIATNGSLSNQRVWADVGEGAPDGICCDGEAAVWYADVPNKRCVRVREGDEVLQIIEVDRGCFACMLGGEDGRTLFILANEWRGMSEMAAVAQARTGRVLTARVRTPRAGWPSN